MISISDFKEFFYRDFNYLTEPHDGDELDFITDTDIAKAISEMACMLPAYLFDEPTLKMAQLYFAAHCLVADIRMGNNGLSSNFTFPLQSHSVGSVSESYAVPQAILTNPNYSFYVTSEYGLRYLALFYPRSRGNVACAGGWTLP